MVQLRITYATFGELRRDVTEQMARGGILVRVEPIADLLLDTPVVLELVLPNGERLSSTGQVLQQLPGFGVAVTVERGVVEEARRRAELGGDQAGVVAQHERLDNRIRAATIPPADVVPRARTTSIHPIQSGSQSQPALAPIRASSPTDLPRAPSPDLSAATDPPARARSASARPAGPIDALSHAQKIHMAMHGTRDERNAVLRDANRSLHPFVLKNPQLNADDVLEICKNALPSPVLLKLISDRKEWFQRPAIALGLARNPKTPPDVAVRALAHVSIDALRLMAKGTGVLPHVAQAARKKILGA